MTDRLEVVAGAGAVLRVGTITAWIGPTASARLLDFVVRTTHNAPRTPAAAQAAADQMIAVLRTGDPEPVAPFAVVGGGAQGIIALLHGPVQLWDATRLVSPNPSPGWLAFSLGTPVLVAVAAAGTSVRGASGSVFDLRDGVVPGAGFVLVPDPAGGAGEPGGTPYATSVPLDPGRFPGGGPGAPGPAVPSSSAPRHGGPGSSSSSDPRGYPLRSDPRPTITPGAADWSVGEPATGGDPSEVPGGPAPGPAAPAGVAPEPAPPAQPAEGEAPAAPAAPAAPPAGWGPESTPPEDLHIPPPPSISVPAVGPTPAGQWPGSTSVPRSPGGQPLRNPTRISSQRVPPPPPPPKLGAVAAGELAAPVTHRPTVSRASATASTNRSDVGFRPPPGTVVDLRSGGPPGAPLPPVGAPAALPPGSTLIDGVRCGRGHFNHPAAATCLRCEAPITDRGAVTGPRPSLGVLVRDDSTVFSLERGYVLGTDPGSDPAVSGGIARPLQLTGPSTEEVSPVHAELRLSGWEVTLIDRGSTYGTFVLRPGEHEWERLPPYQADVLTPGTHVACGQRILTYASPWPAAT